MGYTLNVPSRVYIIKSKNKKYMENLTNEQLSLLSSEALRDLLNLARSHWQLNNTERENNFQEAQNGSNLHTRVQAVLNSRSW